MQEYLDQILIQCADDDVVLAEEANDILAEAMEARIIEHIVNVTGLQYHQSATYSDDKSIYPHSSCCGGVVDYVIEDALKLNWRRIERYIGNLIDDTIEKILRCQTSQSYISHFTFRRGVFDTDSTERRFGFTIRAVVENPNGRDHSHTWIDPEVIKQYILKA